MIRFPKMHLAESVANRLLNFMDGVGGVGMLSPPSLPDPNPNGPLIDAQLNAPPGGAAPTGSVIADAISGERSPLESITQE